jgi:predicted nucleotidyltransferase
MHLTPRERDLLTGFVRRLKTEFRAEEVVLYGSAVRGDMDPESDIDLFVVLPDVNWDVEKRIGDAAFDAGLEIGRVISTACFGKTDIADTPMRSSPFVLNVGREGVSL